MANNVVDDFKTEDMWVSCWKSKGDKYITKSYSKWKGMLQRCDIGGDFQRKHKTYEGCCLSDDFKDFQIFTDWHSQQIGYSLDYHLDKDILIENNKIYSKEACVLVPQSLNNFLCANNGIRGKHPQGVSWNKPRLKFQVHLRISSKSKHIGLYSDLDSAKLAYKEAKEAEAYRWYERLKAGEFVVDERVIERMRVWRFNG